MIKGFKEFILRGNVIDLAVAVVIGAAFSAIVNVIVTSIFNPLMGVLFNATTLAKALPVTIPAIAGGTTATIYFGALIAAVINFLLVAVVVYFALVVPINFIKKRAFQKKEAGQDAVAADTPPTELELLADIRDLLARGTTATAATDHGKHASDPA
ncbi:MAG: large-conductance mechanosensitive channel, MscL family [Glaciihabitans sp.]|jgi:large conductance mechanosensitive channel|nr:large-conductance mechanosensitive channel, MscL family [Glaciihabitans sp.]